MKILLLESNFGLLEKMKCFFSRKHIVAETAADFREGEASINDFDYDLVIIDAKMFKTADYKLVRALKVKSPGTLVVVTSETSDLEDKMVAFDLGVDDYLVRPFDLRELYARVKAIYRRTLLLEANELVLGQLRINLGNQLAYINESLLVLTAKEYELLVFFASNKEKVLSKSIIAEQLWGNYTEVLDNHHFVYQHVKNLRKKMKESGARNYIKTIYGLGYRLAVGA